MCRRNIRITKKTMDNNKDTEYEKEEREENETEEE